MLYCLQQVDLRGTLENAQKKESLVLRLTTLNDYQRQIEAMVNKYYVTGQNLQPFIIVEGLAPDNITGFYIYFNSNI